MFDSRLARSVNFTKEIFYLATDHWLPASDPFVKGLARVTYGE